MVLAEILIYKSRFLRGQKNTDTFMETGCLFYCRCSQGIISLLRTTKGPRTILDQSILICLYPVKKLIAMALILSTSYCIIPACFSLLILAVVHIFRVVFFYCSSKSLWYPNYSTEHIIKNVVLWNVKTLLTCGERLCSWFWGMWGIQGMPLPHPSEFPQPTGIWIQVSGLEF